MDSDALSPERHFIQKQRGNIPARQGGEGFLAVHRNGAGPYAANAACGTIEPNWLNPGFE